MEIQTGWLGLFAAALVAVLVAGGVTLWRGDEVYLTAAFTSLLRLGRGRTCPAYRRR